VFYAQYLDEALLRHLRHHRFSACPLAATPQHLLYARSARIRSRFPVRKRVLDQTTFCRTFASMQPLLQQLLGGACPRNEASFETMGADEVKALQGPLIARCRSGTATAAGVPRHRAASGPCSALTSSAFHRLLLRRTSGWRPALPWLQLLRERGCWAIDVRKRQPFSPWSH